MSSHCRAIASSSPPSAGALAAASRRRRAARSRHSAARWISRTGRVSRDGTGDPGSMAAAGVTGGRLCASVRAARPGGSPAAGREDRGTRRLSPEPSGAGRRAACRTARRGPRPPPGPAGGRSAQHRAGRRGVGCGSAFGSGRGIHARRPAHEGRRMGSSPAITGFRRDRSRPEGSAWRHPRRARDGTDRRADGRRRARSRASAPAPAGRAWRSGGATRGSAAPVRRRS